ncbi:Cellobiose 2-epimerase [Mariniblastus fucicola]|uniref:Cellobiose 2-epimerase n=2 Tax=Mariniblastus fucicola TaxID=980251 RepID=A0A5B9P5J1_9BACT|nr:Cellobiose 2-epimerase [Mariniblastus fucicola]
MPLLILAVGCSSPNEDLVKTSQAQEQAAEKSLDEDAKKHTNALAKESSPYLLMHAHNPVNWYPWSEESLQKARDEGKPIFLSVGYSSCHWCHVMERESFLDEEIASFLNENFICIKVDREERPDVDQIYMESLNVYNQLTRNGQGGGWPLSMFLTSEGKPFFGGTYFPARDGDRGVRVGFLSVVKRIRDSWNDNRDGVTKMADQLTEITRSQLEGSPPLAAKKIKGSWTKRALQQLKRSFDPEWGGFGFVAATPDRPKFPEPSNLLLLQEWIRQQPDGEEKENAKNMLAKTLSKMALGGMYDHLGGGFHRYSVDRFWAIPHFEKMLYDNGQLASVYAEAYKLDPKPEYKRTVEGLLAFVEREMTSPEGGFYSALDAESEGVEGKFYRWEKDEVQKILGDDAFKLFAETYRLNEAPNFESEYYAPQLKSALDAETDAKLVDSRKKLFDVRAKRPRPLLDNKILTGWNGMMIRGFADAGRVFENAHYVDVASRAADFALTKLTDEEGRLWRTNTDGESKLNAYLEDYACLIEGLLALHKATDDKKWIDAAVKLQAKQDELFWDEKNGGYFYTSKDHETLIIRTKRAADGAQPSGSSVSANNLIYLANATKDDSFKDKALATVLSASGLMDKYPTIAPRMLIAALKLKK